MPASPLRILTWHIHGSYLYYLTQTGHTIYLPVRPDRSQGYGGRWPNFPPNAHEVPVAEVPRLALDCIIMQSPRNYLEDQHAILSPEQRRLPKIYLEHDPPREHPTDTRHLVDDPNILLVHVTPFNDLMWDSGRTPTQVVEHGVVVPEDARYSGELERGIVVVNNLRGRGRRLGADIFERARREVPLDLVGIDAASFGGLGEVRHHELPAFVARYRFFFNPIRYTSLGLAVCEAMMVGLPIVGLATTEMATAVENDVSGYVDTDVDRLIAAMRTLLREPARARRLSQGARQAAERRFSIQRFRDQWDAALARVIGGTPRPVAGVATAEGRGGEQPAPHLQGEA